MKSWRGPLSVVTRVMALGCGLAAGILGVYGVMLIYAAATFEHDSLPGPEVLYLMALGVGLLTITCGGLSHVLWRRSRQPSV